MFSIIVALFRRLQGSFSQPLRPYATLCTSVEACNIIAITERLSPNNRRCYLSVLQSYNKAKLLTHNKLQRKKVKYIYILTFSLCNTLKINELTCVKISVKIALF